MDWHLLASFYAVRTALSRWGLHWAQEKGEASTSGVLLKEKLGTTGAPSGIEKDDYFRKRYATCESPDCGARRGG